MFRKVTELSVALELSTNKNQTQVRAQRRSERANTDQATYLSNDRADQTIIFDDVVFLLGVRTIASVLSQIVTSADILLPVYRDGTADDVILSAAWGLASQGTSSEKDVVSSGDQGRGIGHGRRNGDGQRKSQQGGNGGEREKHLVWRKGSSLMGILERWRSILGCFLIYGRWNSGGRQRPVDSTEGSRVVLPKGKGMRK